MVTALNGRMFILGATGEVGKELVKELVATSGASQVVVIGRRRIEYEQEDLKGLEQRIIDFDKLEDNIEAFQGFKYGFCCLGTTRGKAGAAGFYKVDHDYVVNSARLAKEGGCEHFSVVSSQAANKNAFLLYPKTKGQMEEDLKALGFPRLDIYRPSLLLCERQESRLAERFFQFLVPKTINVICPNKYSIETSTVAKAMVKNLFNNSDANVNIVENIDIYKMAQEA